MSPRSQPGGDDGTETRRRRPRRVLLAALLLTAAMALAANLAYRWLLAGMERYADTGPDPLPAATLTPANREDVARRLAAFRKALETHRGSARLTLTADELNALVAATPGLGGKFRTEIVEGTLRARFSLPLEDLGYPQLRGRFLNGTSILDVSVTGGELVVSPREFEVKGGPLPEAIRARLRRGNLARLAFRDPRVARGLRGLGSVEVRDGSLEIKSR